MPIQTRGSYTDFQGLGFEGASADAHLKECATGVNLVEAMPFGRIVIFGGGGNDRSVILPASSGGTVMGATFHSHFGSQFDLVTGVAQVSTVTLGVTAIADGDQWIITLFLPGIGAGLVFNITRAAGVPLAINDVSTAMRLAINNGPQASLSVAASGAGADVIITSNEPGSFGVLAEVVDGGGTPTAAHALTTGGEADGIPQNDAANLIKKGTMWVRPEAPVTPTSGVFFRHTANAGVGTALGAFRGTADGGNTDDISTMAKWLTSSQGGAEGGLAKLQLNLP